MRDTLTICAATTADEIEDTFQERKWNEYKAEQCDKLAIDARSKGNAAMQALWELYAKQYRARGGDF